MQRFSILICYLCSLLLLSACSSESAETSSNALQDKPNIVWIVAEDLGSYIPSFGDSTVVTPNLSRLAAEGVRYTNVFSTSGVCAPSRAALALGLYQNYTGGHHMRNTGQQRYLPPGVQPYEALPPVEVKMHAEYLRRAGYYTTNNAKEDYQFKKTVTAWDESSQNAHWRNRPDPNQPFFAIFNLGITHESQIWARAEDSLWVDADLDVPIPPYYPDTDVVRNDIRRLYSNIKIMDSQVGDLLDQLEEDGLMENTIIFWYTDHGGPLPRMKRLLYDSGLQVPMIIRFPGQERAGEIDDQMISFVDFKPTILSLAGIEPPSYLEGQGQAFLGPYKAAAPRTYIHAAADRFDERYDMIRAVRDNRFKYLRNYRPDQGYYLPISYREQMPLMQELLRMRDAGTLNETQMQWFRPSKPEEELFDTDADPHEINNMANDPAYAEKLVELRAEHDRWVEAIDDKGKMSETEYIDMIWPGRIQPVTEAPQVTRNGAEVTLASPTQGASIGYQIVSPGAEPGDTWQVYTDPVSLPENQELIAIADRIGYVPSGSVRVD